MKRLLPLLAFASILLVGCDNSKLNYSTQSLKKSTQFIEVEINYPKFDFQHGDINSAVYNALLIFSADEGIGGEVSTTLEEQLDILEKEAAEQSKEFGDIKYGISTNFSLTSFQNLNSLYLEKYQFMGGAHPDTFMYIINFDDKGNVVDNKDIINDNDELRNKIAAKFCEDNNITLDTPSEEIGLFVDLKEFPISQNIGFSQDSVIFYYNRYEIAPYARGVIEVKLAVNDIKEIFKNSLIITME